VKISILYIFIVHDKEAVMIMTAIF